MKKAVKVGLVTLLLIVGSLGFYLYKLHALAAEGNRIFEYRCLHVNPYLIRYKNTFLQYADQINNPDWASDDHMTALLYIYNSEMRSYVTMEDIWLAMDKEFIQRWDYWLFEPWYIRVAGAYQWYMYKGYRDDAAGIMDVWDHPERAAAITDPQYVSEERQRRDMYIDKYFEFFRYASTIADWRKFFGQVPVPAGCTKENMTIPDTSGSINWDKTMPAIPSGAPIDPYLTS